jgi:selenocysteine lyase/cysteine desulfurase
MDAVALPDEGIDWAKLRGRYKATSRGVYLNAGSRGLMSDTARAAGETHLRSDCESPGSNPARTQQLAEARDTFAHLIHAESGTVALTKNVSEGLNIIATAVD